MRGLVAEHTRHVGAAHIVNVETGVDDRTDVCPVAVETIGGEQHDHRTEFVTVDRQVHAPFAHHVVPDHVRCPRVAFERGVLRLLRPCLPDAAEQRGRVARQIVLEAFPVDEVGTAGAASVGAEDVVRTVVLDDGRVVDGDAARGERVFDESFIGGRFGRGFGRGGGCGHGLASL